LQLRGVIFDASAASLINIVPMKLSVRRHFYKLAVIPDGKCRANVHGTPSCDFFFRRRWLACEVHVRLILAVLQQ